MTGARRAQGRKVHIFGESVNDVKSLHYLLLYANPALAGKVVEHPSVSTISSDASPEKVKSWIWEMRNKIETAAFRAPPLGVLVHRDADQADPRGQLHQLLTQQLQDFADLTRVGAVVPVQELEAWWFLFPAAVEAVNPGAWAGIMPRIARDVEMINDPKNELKRCSSSKNRQSGRIKKYQERDSPAIAQKIRLLNVEPLGTSKSFDLFRTLAKDIA